MDDFSKAYFQKVWGGGYYEHFSYGVGIDKVFEVCVSQFLKGTVLEIGSGGGVFTEMIQGKADLIAIDVIKMPERFKSFERFTYYELEDRSYTCDYIDSESINFCFCFVVQGQCSNPNPVR